MAITVERVGVGLDISCDTATKTVFCSRKSRQFAAFVVQIARQNPGFWCRATEPMPCDGYQTRLDSIQYRPSTRFASPCLASSAATHSSGLFIGCSSSWGSTYVVHVWFLGRANQFRYALKHCFAHLPRMPSLLCSIRAEDAMTAPYVLPQRLECAGTRGILGPPHLTLRREPMVRCRKTP